MTGNNGGLYMMTVTGKRFPLLHPDWRLVCIEDIAHALSQTCRYGGQSPKFLSVAEHCCLVAEQVDRGRGWRSLFALLHDASEAYVGDVISPVKQAIGLVYQQLEQHVQETVLEGLGLIWPQSAKESEELDRLIRAADLAVGAAECALIGFDITPGREQTPAPVSIHFLWPKDAKAKFMLMYAALMADYMAYAAGDKRIVEETALEADRS